MAAIVGRQSTLVASERYDRVVKVTSDKDVTECTITDLVKVLLKYLTDTESVWELNRLQARPLTSSKCNEVIRIIRDASCIEVVPNERNYHEASGLIKFVWERARIVTTDTVLLQQEGRGLSALGARSHEAGLNITISKSAWDAMQRHARALEQQEDKQLDDQIYALRQRRIYEEMIRTRNSQNAYLASQRRESGCNFCTIL